MAYNDIHNPITITHMLRNILCKAGDYGRALRIEFITGTVVGVPQETLDEKGFRNLLNMAIKIGLDTKPVLRVYVNEGDITDAFPSPSFDTNYNLINSLFVNVAENPLVLTEYVTCVNIAEIFAIPTVTPTPTLAPTTTGTTPTPTAAPSGTTPTPTAIPSGTTPTPTPA